MRFLEEVGVLKEAVAYMTALSEIHVEITEENRR
jgi:hypothetical protein